MKTKHLKSLFICTAAVLLSVLLLCGCGASKGAGFTNGQAISYGGEMPPSSGATAPAPERGNAAADGETAVMSGAGQEEMDIAPASTTSRKIIRRAGFYLETLSFEEDTAKINAEITARNGYVQQSNTYGSTENGDAHLGLTARIPAAEYEAFKSFLNDTFRVLSTNEGGEDVTAQYVDTQARLRSLTAQEERLITLYDKAETIEDLVAIESKLSDVRMNIEQLTAQMKQLDEQIDYATVSVELQQTKSLTPEKQTGFFARIWDTIASSLQAGLVTLENILFGIIWLIPYLLVALIAFLIARRLWKKHKSKLPKKETEKLQNNEESKKDDNT